MKLKFLSGLEIEDGQELKAVDYLDLDLCGQGRAEGNAAGLVPVKLPSGVVVTPTVTVSSATSTTKRSSRSAVVKVSMPYSAIVADSEGNYAPDPNRSGADISMHLVVALPAAATKDIQGLNGIYQKYAAEAQVALLHALLRTLIGDQFGGQPMLDDDSGNLVTKSTSVKIPQVGDGPEYPPTVDNQAVIASENVGSYEGAGFDLSSLRLPQRLNGFTSRIANGLPMLSCGDVEAEPLARVHHTGN